MVDMGDDGEITDQVSRCFGHWRYIRGLGRKRNMARDLCFRGNDRGRIEWVGVGVWNEARLSYPCRRKVGRFRLSNINRGGNMDPFAVFALTIVSLAVVLVMTGLKIVPQTENWLVERLGRFHRTLDAGVHIVIPLYDKVAHRESIVERQLPEKVVPAFTKDNVQITIRLAILYRVTDAGRAWYRIKNIDQAIETIIISIVRSTIGSSELDQVQSNRGQISSVIATEIQHVTDEWGIHVTRTEITDVEVDEQTRKAMAMQLNAERTRRAVVTEAEGKRSAANLGADAELYTAQQKAQAQRILADAQAYSVQTVARAIADNGQAAIDFDVRKIQADAIKALGQGNATKVVILPADALAALTGALSKLKS
ncbi:MAG: hypothetical protein B7Z71_11975 [Acidocella sp. 21-58-7]|nr:MAG: hypothetical protein B7Z71_11975 [Acidocella sp. 21-58-7]